VQARHNNQIQKEAVLRSAAIIHSVMCFVEFEICVYKDDY